MVPRRCSRRALAAAFFILAVVAPAPPAAHAQEARSLTLEEAIFLAWEQGPDLEEQRRAVAEAELNARRAGVSYRPQVGLNAGYDAVEGADGTVTVTLSLAQSFALEPLLGGDPPEEVRRAQTALDQARRRLEDAYQDVALSTLEAYLDLLESRASVRQSAAALDRAEELLEQTELRARQQAAGTVDLYEARADALAARQALAQAELEASRAEANLNRLLGLPRRTPLEVEEPEGPLPLEDDAREWATASGLDDLVAEALARRVDLIEARENLAEARTSLAELKRPWEPTFSLSATYTGADASLQATLPLDTWEVALSGQAQVYSSRGEPLSRPSLEDPRGWSAGLDLSLPLLDGSARRTAWEQQSLQVQRLEAQVRELEAQIAEEVRLALESYLLALETVPVRALQLEAAEALLEAQEQRYQAGVITPGELTEARNGYDSAVAAHTSARFQVLRSAAGLMRAAGLDVLPTGAARRGGQPAPAQEGD